MHFESIYRHVDVLWTYQGANIKIMILARLCRLNGVEDTILYQDNHMIQCTDQNEEVDFTDETANFRPITVHQS